MDYHSVFCGDEQLPKFLPTAYVIVRRFTIPGIESKYYDVRCQEEMAGCDDLASHLTCETGIKRTSRKVKAGSPTSTR